MIEMAAPVSRMVPISKQLFLGVFGSEVEKNELSLELLLLSDLEFKDRQCNGQR